MFADRPKSGIAPRGILLIVPLSLWVLAPPAGAVAADGPGGERPATWDMTVEELQEIGLGQSRGEPRPVPAEFPHERNPGAPPEQASQGQIFVNFDGASLSSGYDDSRNNVTQIGELVGNFAAYGTGDKREAVMQAVRADWAPFNMIITDTRPASGNYTMNMTGPTNPFGQGVLGIAPVDCGDSQTHNNITYAFHSAGDQHSAAVTATTIGQEVAHSYGLEHVDNPADIMNPFNAGGDASFTDQCLPIVQNLYCPSQHQAECGTQSQQNSYAELMTLFGPAMPDAAPPSVSITYPADGDVFAPGSDFTIMVSADDDQGIEQVTLYSNGTSQGTDGDAPFGWEVNDIPEGSYELHVVATDTAGNQTTSGTVTIEVSDTPPPPSDDGGLDDGGLDDGGLDDGGLDDGGLDDGGPDDGGQVRDDGALPPGYGFGQDDDEAGCACRSTPSSGRYGLLGLLGLMLVGAVRRRS